MVVQKAGAPEVGRNCWAVEKASAVDGFYICIYCYQTNIAIVADTRLKYR